MTSSGEQLQTNGEGIVPQRLTINDTGPSPEIPRQRPQVQPLIEPEGIVRNHTRAMGAHVVRQALVGTMANVKATEIHAYGKRRAFFDTKRDCFHGTPDRAVGIM